MKKVVNIVLIGCMYLQNLYTYIKFILVLPSCSRIFFRIKQKYRSINIYRFVQS